MVDSSARAGRVLIIDDDPLVGRTLRRLLAPHEVLLLESARAALETLAEDGQFDAILCDVRMPGLSGLDFAKELEHVAPTLVDRLVLMSGGSIPPSAPNAPPSTPGRLFKPFTTEELRGVVGALVARGRNG